MPGVATNDPDVGDEEDGQLTLGVEDARREARAARARKPKPKAQAERLPVARVVVDKGLVHLDRLFDYSVPAKLAEVAQPGVRVRVRFGAKVVDGRRQGGGLIDGVIVERVERSTYGGPLAPLASVISPEIVLAPPMIELARAVADRYAGTLADVVQIALPARHARAEAEPSGEPLVGPAAPAPGPWTRYPAGAAHLAELAAGESPRTVWTALPGPYWPDEIARAMVATLAGGRGALAVVPDAKSVERVDAALTALLGRGRHVALTSGLGPEERYRRWLAINRGSVRVVVGTRAAMFAPVVELGLALVWNDGDDSHADPNAPYPHVREVLAMRAAREHAAFTVGGHATTVEAAQLVRSGWARPLDADRAAVRAAAPLVRTTGSDLDLARDEAARAARLPSLAWDIARKALQTGPVLVQVPRRGYLVRTSCLRCREPARCAHCSGPLELPSGNGVLTCGWCTRPAPNWHCRVCGGDRIRAGVIGARRTAEELGRAFPTVPVRTSGRDAILTTVPDLPALIIATPGAEPVAPGGYAAALLLDGWALLTRPDLRAGEQALRRWLDAASLVRPAGEGGTLVVVAESTLRPVQALVRWDPQGYALTELVERTELNLPPVSRMASVTGPPAGIADFLAVLRLPDGADVLGPVPVAPTVPRTPPPAPAKPNPKAADTRAELTRALFGDTPPPTREPVRRTAPPARHERVLLRIEPGRGAELAHALKAAQTLRLARAAGDPVQLRIDPPDIG
ncbi:MULTISPECIES: primosomal protein N' [Streptomycetaceae]|uniref:primosomal protein N' n=1 Tax=Embleya scabrispora TaxID=159449 RepID=UPI0005930EC9|nr:primosomal protein N' [Streptomyces sp. SID5474]